MGMLKAITAHLSIRVFREIIWKVVIEYFSPYLVFVVSVEGEVV